MIQDGSITFSWDQVRLLRGQVYKEFPRANPVISQTILIRGDQTLQQLHDIIFDAFDREDEHMYEFQVGGTRPMDAGARCYVHSAVAAGPCGDQHVDGLASETMLDALQMKAGQAFFYWFDYGDDWWHRIKVVAILQAVAGEFYPKVIAKVGASPPQYPDCDDQGDVWTKVVVIRPKQPSNSCRYAVKAGLTSRIVSASMPDSFQKVGSGSFIGAPPQSS